MQIDNRIRILVMLQIMLLNISSPLYVITKISAIISRYLTANFDMTLGGIYELVGEVVPYMTVVYK